MLSKTIIFVVVITSSLLGEARLEVGRLFRQASSGEIRFTKLVQPSKDSLIAMADSAAKYLVERLNTTDAREALTLVDIYRGIGTKSTPYLLEALKTDNKYQLRTTCRCLADIKDTSAIDALLSVATHADYTVRSEALTAIGKSGGGERTAVRLEAFINDSIPVVRKSCVAGLGNLKSPSSLSLLIAALADNHFAVRLTAYDALVGYDSVAAERIAALLDSVTNPETASLAIRLAGQLRLRKAQESVQKYLTNGNPLLRGWSVWALGRVEGKAAEDRLKKLQTTETDLFVKSLLSETLTYIDTSTTHE